MAQAEPNVRYATPAGRWVIVAVVLGSGAAFLEGTVVSVALPSIGREFGLDLSGIQWITNGYLLTLSALIILGGSLGDLFGRRRMFVTGLAGFGVMSLVCSIAPNVEVLIGARLLQGIAGAMLVPSSLAIVDTVFAEQDRGRAIGAWSSGSAISTAFGPFVGGYLVDVASWRLVFLIVVVFVAAAIPIAIRHVPETRDEEVRGVRPDYLGAALISLGLAGLTYALVEGPTRGVTSPFVAVTGIGGVAALIAFVATERRVAHPMLPFAIFSSKQFTGANLVTLANYFALGGAFFFLVLQLQNVLGYSAIAAGAALLPVNVLMFTLSPQAGKISQRIGPRIPLTIGPMVVAAGLVLLGNVKPGSSYATSVLPAAVVFGMGLTIFVAPLTAAVLAAVDEHQAGIGSAINNATARLAGLLAAAVLPIAAGLSGQTDGAAFAAGFQRAMYISAGVSVVGGLIAFATVRRATRIQSRAHPHVSLACSLASEQDEPRAERGAA
ncbi:MAG: DHA2 family efflux MFS transporter permease subunit [Actinobacteria bacterium]|nr:DHA2 family efflux MFS transporter permease subunit [Actinomycetota bacterium]